MGEHSLTIKEWAGTGTPDLKLERKAAKTSTKYSVSGPLEMLEITRKSDGSFFQIRHYGKSEQKQPHSELGISRGGIRQRYACYGSEIPGTDCYGFYRGGGGRLRLSRR